LRIFPYEPEISSGDKEYKIDMYNIKETFLANLIRALYKAGYNRIILSSSKIISPRLINIIKETIGSLPGTEIAYQRPREIVLEIRTENIELRELIHKGFSLVSGAMEYVSALIEEASIEYLENLKFIQESFHGIRALTVRLSNGGNCRYILVTLYSLEKILEAIVKIAILTSFNFKSDLKNVKRSLRNLFAIFQRVKNTYLEANIEQAKEVIDEISKNDFLGKWMIEDEFTRILDSHFKDIVSSCTLILECIIIDSILRY